MVYTLFNGRFTWEQTVAICRTMGMSIATVPSLVIAKCLGISMLKSRPDLENLWIGAYYHKSEWQWVTSGTVLPSVTGQDGYPPWLNNSSINRSGCVLLDRHLRDHPVFVEMRCDLKRGFICEQPLGLEDGSPKEVKIQLDDRTVTLYSIKRSWTAAFMFCLHQNSRLITLNNYRNVRDIVDGMADHMDELKHVWVGGNLLNSTWIWSATGEKISSMVDSDGFPPWCPEVMSPERACLNLDRQSYNKPLLYGLSCNVTQPFICESGLPNMTASNGLEYLPLPGDGNKSSTTEAPTNRTCHLHVLEGSWHNCTEVLDLHYVRCTLVCAHPFSAFGSREVRCSSETVDLKGYRSLHTPPQCLTQEKLISHFERTLHTLYSSTKRPDSILFLLNGNTDIFRITGEFLETFILTLPLDKYFPAGMISYAGNEILIPLKETDACHMQLLVRGLAAEERENREVDIVMGLKLAHDIFYNNNKQHGILVLFWNGTDHIPDYQKYKRIVERLRGEGHYMFAIGEVEGMNKQLEPFVSSDDTDLYMYIFRSQQQNQHWHDFEGYIHEPEKKNCINEDIKKRAREFKLKFG